MPSHRPLTENRPKRPPEARKSDKNTANTQQVRFFKLYFDFNVFSAENRRLFSIEFQLHTNSHITLWLPVLWRVDQLRAATAVTFRLFILGDQVCDKRFKIEC